MQALKETLGAVAREKAWADEEKMATSAIYFCVAKSTIKIDRRGGVGGGRVTFKL
jgi:hypothetical protein